MVKIEAGEVDAVISVVTLAEIFYKYLHEKNTDLAETRTTDLRHAVYLKKLEIGRRLQLMLERLKANTKFQ